MKSPREYFSSTLYYNPAINICSLLDFQNARIMRGSRGEHIVNGGLSFQIGIAGRQNSYKSTLARFLGLTAFSRFHTEARYTFYDTEGHASIERDMELAKSIPGLEYFDFYSDPKYAFVSSAYEPGEKFYASLREMLREKSNKENLKENVLTCPIIDPAKDKSFNILRPDFIIMDTASRFCTSANEEMIDKKELGAKELNMVDMNAGRVRNNLFGSVNGLLIRNGGYLISPAHIGKAFQMDMYAPDPKQLKDIKNGFQLKGVPESFTSLTTDIWYVLNAAPLTNSSTKSPQYPRDANENQLSESKDLYELTIVNLRGKNGMSGSPFKLVVSQTEGVLPDLSCYHFLKEENGWGMDGSINGYHSLDLFPDTKLSRTTVRSKIDESYALKRALQITCESRLIDKFWIEYDRDLWCPPKVLFEDIKKLGYDWDELLNTTRGWWMPLELEKNEPLKYLSTEDLFRMRKGLYKPYWMQ
jgi:hypothetical protein